MNRIQKFLASPSISVLWVALSAGLYPLFFYYSNNYALINTWKHLGFFMVLFIVVPIVIFFVVDLVLKRKSSAKLRSQVLLFLNSFAFLAFILLCLYAGFQTLFTLGACLLAIIVGLFLYRFLNKIVLMQLLLAVINLFWLVPTIFEQINYNDSWTEQPDDIEAAVFTKHPNVYYIQTDGYVNFSEQDKGYYKLGANDLKPYLEENKFTSYPNVRSNYSSTVISNAATFMMKHHYYNYGFNFTEITNGRQIIMSDNPVLHIFKNNGYKTHFISEMPYFLANKPKVGYDRSNFNKSNISYINNGFSGKQKVTDSLQRYLAEDVDQAKFFFIQIFKPGHVPSKQLAAQGLEKDKELWVKNLAVSNAQLKELVDTITSKDPNALIMIMADHGGYVGWEYMLELRHKTQDRDKLHSAFSTILEIKWPDNAPPVFDDKFRSGVNVFRILFSYLSDDTSYLEHLQDDASFTIIEKGAPKGIYKVINAEGETTFEKRNK